MGLNVVVVEFPFLQKHGLTLKEIRSIDPLYSPRAMVEKT